MRKPFFRLQPESGIAIGPILLVIALLAILAAAIAAGGSSYSGNTDSEKAQAYASTVLDYAATVSAAVARVMANGCTETQISFENSVVTGYTNASAPSDHHCHVFDIAGGGLLWFNPPTDVLDTSNTAQYEYGHSLYQGNWGVTNLSASPLLIVFIPYVNQATCQKINRLLSFPVTTTSFVPWINSVHTITQSKFTGSYVNNGSVYPDGTGCTSKCYARPAGCLWMDNWNYNATAITATGVFYKVLNFR